MKMVYEQYFNQVFLSLQINKTYFIKKLCIVIVNVKDKIYLFNILLH